MRRGSKPRIVDPAKVVPQPWRNGRGVTREVAVGPGWRVRVADIVKDGPFSTFPAVDRLFSPLSSDVRLLIDGLPLAPRAFEVLAFPGEWPVEVRGLRRRTQALNVMTDRDTCVGHVRFGTATDPVPRDVSVRVLLGCRVADIRFTPLAPTLSL